MSLTAFLRQVIEMLDEAGVPYMLTGSLASAYYAIPRATQDLDVVIATDEARVEEIVQRLSRIGWYVDRADGSRGGGQFASRASDPGHGGRDQAVR